MPAPFRKVTLEQFATLLDNFNFQRRITEVHMHHTSSPNHSQWRGHDSVVSMFRHHTQVRGFSDIAQHITIAPDGSIFLGRNWNRAPASAVGFNGNSQRGPFMFEMVGDFNTGHDPFVDPQKRTALQVVALVQKRFNLPVDTVRFHRQMSDTDCPGGSLRRADVIAAVAALRGARTAAPLEGEEASRALGDPDDLPFSPEHFAAAPPSASGTSGGKRARSGDTSDTLVEPAPLTDELRALVREFEQTGMIGARSGGRDEEDLHEDSMTGARGEGDDTARGSGLSIAERETLRPHLVNLNQGQFSEGGEFKTTREDVDALFAEHLRRYREERGRHPEQGERKVRLLFWAHGGLVAEGVALRYAHDNLDWWLENGIYPIFFVWETGFFETIGQLLRNARSRSPAGRDIFDFTTDPILEGLARTLGGVRIWGGMKDSAARASTPGRDANDLDGMGGARYVARKLAEFCAAPEGGVPVELYAVGHSAGAIFHSQFLPAARAANVPDFNELYLLAPAIRCDEFKARLMPLLGAGNGIAQTTMFTMNRLREQDDHCAQVYRKSLLYMIHFALEPKRKEAILGLEDSLRADSQLRPLFGLGGSPPGNARVIFSKTPESTGRSATESISHGGFDEDPATLDSIARRVRNDEDADPLPRPYPRRRAAGVADTWNEQVDLPEELAEIFSSLPTPVIPTPEPVVVSPPLGFPDGGRNGGQRGGSKRALCVGINAYIRQPLNGCVADARNWEETLRGLGFSTARLLDGQATRDGILNGLRTLIRGSRPGDTLVFQYSGHGTTVPDQSGDDRDDPTPFADEALCPVDFHTGSLLLDDDLGRELALLPDGVALTLFMDCCHSGTISRFVALQAEQSRAVGDLPRLLTLTPDEIAAHERQRQRLGGARGFGAGPLSHGPATQKEVLFSACRSDELAWESAGQGEFTVRTTRLLQSLGVSGLASISNNAFHGRVVAAFGASPRQQPQLDCAPTARERGFLQPLSRSGEGGNSVGTTPVPSPSPAGTASDLAIAAALEQIANALRQRGDSGERGGSIARGL